MKKVANKFLLILIIILVSIFAGYENPGLVEIPKKYVNFLSNSFQVKSYDLPKVSSSEHPHQGLPKGERAPERGSKIMKNRFFRVLRCSQLPRLPHEIPPKNTFSTGFHDFPFQHKVFLVIIRFTGLGFAGNSERDVTYIQLSSLIVRNNHNN